MILPMIPPHSSGGGEFDLNLPMKLACGCFGIAVVFLAIGGIFLVWSAYCEFK